MSKLYVEKSLMPKILGIDVEPSIVNLITAYLKPEGYEVHTAPDGPSGLKSARAFKPDLIILDIMLPGRMALSCFRVCAANRMCILRSFLSRR